MIRVKRGVIRVKSDDVPGVVCQLSPPTNNFLKIKVC